MLRTKGKGRAGTITFDQPEAKIRSSNNRRTLIGEIPSIIKEGIKKPGNISNLVLIGFTAMCNAILAHPNLAVSFVLAGVTCLQPAVTDFGYNYKLIKNELLKNKDLKTFQDKALEITKFIWPGIVGQILHGCATTTHAIRKELQRSQATIKELSEQYNINPKTVIKWRQRKEEGVEDRSNAPKKATTILKPEDEALIIAFRKSTQLPLDDCFDALIKEIPYLTRSNLYRCLKRYGLSCLPKEDNIKEKKKFKAYEIGFMHLDITEVRIGEGKFYIFVAICRVSKFAYVELHNNSNGDTTVNFLDNLVSSCPFKIHTILTDNGVQFAYNGLARYRAPQKLKDYSFLIKITLRELYISIL
ncbi:hypothetical protein NOVO_06355 [Rickettsiales bacterium Ac37b]|nr:hypothetical protein NOVO_06355 [Rickettsiales bacterium Ac37b]